MSGTVVAVVAVVGILAGGVVLYVVLRDEKDEKEQPAYAPTVQYQPVAQPNGPGVPYGQIIQTAGQIAVSLIEAYA